MAIISTSTPPAETPVVVSGTTQTISKGNAYIANNASRVTFTLPATATVGDPFSVSGNGAGGWKLAQNANQIVHFANVNTTTGTGGSLQSTSIRDSLKLVCVVANLEWNVVASVGSITVT